MNTFALNSHRPRQAGFSVMEVLIAIGIFGLGFVAIATIFPTGALLQRQSADDIRARQVGQNAFGKIRGVPPTSADLAFYFEDDGNYDANDNRIEYREFPVNTSEPTLESFWPYENRAYPVTLTRLEERQFHWVPLIRNASGDRLNPDWQLCVFVMRRQRHYHYAPAETDHMYPNNRPDDVPQLVRLAINEVGSSYIELDTTPLNDGLLLTDLLGVGDQFLDDAGNVHRVSAFESGEPDRIYVRGVIEKVAQTESDGTTTTDLPSNIWFAPARGDVDPSTVDYAASRRPRSSALQIRFIDPDGTWGGQVVASP